MLKLEFAQINAKKFPHLVDQLEFLANFVEDFLDGADAEIPYSSAAQAMFALLYCHQRVQIIPHFVQDFGYADDSAVVRAVLIENEKVFQTYAFKNSYNWRDISTQP